MAPMSLCALAILALAAPTSGWLRGLQPGFPGRVAGVIYSSEVRGVGLFQERFPQHIVIETPKPAVSGLRAHIQNASAASFRRQPRIVFVSFDDDSDIERSPNGVPVLGSMFEAAIKHFPQADTYTYFNSDIAVDDSFLATADAIVEAVKIGSLKSRFLVVGQRTNVDWANSIGDEFDFLQEFKRGKLFRSDAEDYFMVSSTSFRWDDIPHFIVGHRGYDNWLVSEALFSPGMDLVDATPTLHALHMTDGRIGNKEGFLPSPDGADYNMHLMGKGSLQRIKMTCGSTAIAEFVTQWNNSNVVFARRTRSCLH